MVGLWFLISATEATDAFVYESLLAEAQQFLPTAAAPALRYAAAPRGGSSS